MPNEPAMIETQVKTKTVSKTAMAIAVAFLGVAALAAASAGLRVNDRGASAKNTNSKNIANINGTEYGDWLVLVIKKESKGMSLAGVRLQKYNKLQEAFFKDLLEKGSPLEKGLDSELILNFGSNRQASAFFVGQEQLMFDKFDEDNGSISSGGADDELNINLDELQEVKVPVNIRDLPSLSNILVKNLKTLETTALTDASVVRSLIEKLKPDGKTIFLSPPSLPSSQITCKDLKEVVMGHNNQLDSSRTNIVFISSGYVDINQFIISLPYFVDLSETGFKGERLYFGEQTGVKFKNFGLFHYIPFSTNEDKFNFWYSDRNFEPGAPPSAVPGCSSCDTCMFCKTAEIKEFVKGCDLANLKVVILCDKPCVSCAVLGSKYEMVSTDVSGLRSFTNLETGQIFSSDMELGPVAFKHEWGHQFGVLKDEYVMEVGKDGPGYPNCASSEQEGNDWWLQLFPPLYMYNGCSYVEDNFRFYNDGLMRLAEGGLQSIVGIGEDMRYGKINELYMCYQMFKASGEVGGDCKTMFPEKCADNLDNDLDQKVDCLDSDCGCYEHKEVSCKDNLDNDGDGKTDCLDADCPQTSCHVYYAETTYMQVENKTYLEGVLDVAGSCHDGVDNDKNGRMDRGEFGFCYDKAGGFEATCNDNIDNDADSLIDCVDSDCEGRLDFNGKVCKYSLPAHSVAICGGKQGIGCFNQDNLPSGWLATTSKKDFFCDVYGGIGSAVNQTVNASSYGEAAFNCCTYLSNFLSSGKFTGAEYKNSLISPDSATEVKFYNCFSKENCSNYLDDDGDGKVDNADADCKLIHYEPNGEQTCNDNIDNDNDGPPDCFDSDCQDEGCMNFIQEGAYINWKDGKENVDGIHTNTSLFCHDNIDNDYNGNLDCKDIFCKMYDPSC